jgi:hypothetical protein
MSGLSSQAFDDAVDTVGVRGDRANGPSLAPYFGWSPTWYLTKESSGNGLTYPGKHFWSGVIKIPKDSIQAGDTLAYKYIIGYDWGRNEGDPNNIVAVPVSNKDTTIYFTYYNREKPVVKELTDTLDLTFIANMTTATQRGFTLNDTLKVVIGYFGTGRPLSGEIAETTVTMLKQGSTQNYAANVQLLGSVSELMDYQYYMRPGISSTLEREYYFNFGYTGDVSAEQERRQMMITAKTLTITDDVVSVTDARRQPYFANPDTLDREVSVLWQVNLKPAYYQVIGGETLNDVQGTTAITPALKDSIGVWGAQINGPATGDWQTWGSTLFTDTSRIMYDDGTHGDKVAGDSVWSRTIVYPAGMATTKGKVFKFGIKGGDNETGFGLNHLANIDDTNPTFEILAYWGSINPTFYDYWDFNTNTPKVGTGVEIVDGIPQAYAMSQNYPNPFNPSTSIDFSLPEASKVSLKVFNILGQEVAEIATGVLQAGTHRANFDASHLSTGIYFYRLTAGNFASMKRMVLVK